MGQDISKRDETLGRELGFNMPDIQIFGEGAQSAVHDERDREFEFAVSADKRRATGISIRGRVKKSAVSGDAEHNKKMDQ